MAAFLNICRFNPTAGGTTDWTASTAVIGYLLPAAAGAVNGRAYKYRAESADLSQWEIGEGTYDTATGVLSRTTVLFNSAGTTAKIDFSTVPQVAVVALKEDLISVEEANSFAAAQQGQARANINAQVSGSYQAALGYTPVNRAGDTITGGLTVNGELVAATNYIRFVTSGGPGYLQYNGGSSYSLGSAGAIWHTGNLNPVSKSGDTMGGVLNSANSGIVQTGGSLNSFMVQGPAGGHAAMSFLVQGQFGGNFGMDNGGNFYMGGWSFGGVAYKFWTTRDFGSPIINGRLGGAADATHSNPGHFSGASAQVRQELVVALK